MLTSKDIKERRKQLIKKQRIRRYLSEFFGLTWIFIVAYVLILILGANL